MKLALVGGWEEWSVKESRYLFRPPICDHETGISSSSHSALVCGWPFPYQILQFFMALAPVKPSVCLTRSSPPSLLLSILPPLASLIFILGIFQDSRHCQSLSPSSHYHQYCPSVSCSEIELSLCLSLLSAWTAHFSFLPHSPGLCLLSFGPLTGYHRSLHIVRPRWRPRSLPWKKFMLRWGDKQISRES